MRCSPDSDNGYLAVEADADERITRGEKQVLCLCCHRWRWPHERPVVVVNPKTHPQSTPGDVGCLSCGAAASAPCVSLGQQGSPRGRAMATFHTRRKNTWNELALKGLV